MQPRSDFTTDLPELPSLDPGVTLLSTEDGDRLPLQALAVDRLLCEGGSALWVGTGRHCVTDSLVRLAPSRRVLDRVRVARGFTPYQHLTLLRRLERELSPETAVVVVPEFDARYRDDAQGDDGRDLLVRALATVARVARECDVPVLVTRRRADEFAAPVEAAATTTIEHRETPMGPRFVGEDHETLVYPLGDGWVQTTLAFWTDVLEARTPLYAAANVPGEVSVGGAN